MVLSNAVGLTALLCLIVVPLVTESPWDRLRTEQEQAARAGRELDPQRTAELATQGRRQVRWRSFAMQAVAMSIIAGVYVGASRMATTKGRLIPVVVWSSYSLLLIATVVIAIGAERSDRLLDESDRRRAALWATDRAAYYEEQTRLVDRAAAARSAWTRAGTLILTAGVAVMLIGGPPAVLRHVSRGTGAVPSEEA